LALDYHSLFFTGGSLGGSTTCFVSFWWTAPMPSYIISSYCLCKLLTISRIGTVAFSRILVHTG
jgi:hypothetical protein